MTTFGRTNAGPLKSSHRFCQALGVAGVTSFLALCTSLEAQTITKDKVSAREGILQANASYSGDAGGRRGSAGDRALDLTTAGGYMSVPVADFLNAATTNDELSLGFWMKKYDIANSSAFW